MSSFDLDMEVKPLSMINFSETSMAREPNNEVNYLYNTTPSISTKNIKNEFFASGASKKMPQIDLNIESKVDLKTLKAIEFHKAMNRHLKRF